MMEACINMELDLDPQIDKVASLDGATLLLTGKPKAILIRDDEQSPSVKLIREDQVSSLNTFELPSDEVYKVYFTILEDEDPILKFKDRVALTGPLNFHTSLDAIKLKMDQMNANRPWGTKRYIIVQAELVFDQVKKWQ